MAKPTALLPSLVQATDQAKTKEELTQVVGSIRYSGDLKGVAEKMGLHCLVSKKMRARELRRWIIDNHRVTRGNQGLE